MGSHPPRNVYFGLPGFLEVIEWPRSGIQADRTRPVSTYPLASGGVRVQKLLGGKRRYTLQWDALSYEEFCRIYEYAQGHNGVGPFALLDPRQRNILTVNQSSATSESNDINGFTLDIGTCVTVGLSSDADVYHRGPRSLLLDLTSCPVTGAPAATPVTVTLDTPTTDFVGSPVVSGWCYTFSFWTYGGGVYGVMTVTPQILWYDSDDAYISTSSGTPTNTVHNSWLQMYVTATAPGNAAYCLCRVSVDQTTIVDGSSINFDEFQLEVCTCGEDDCDCLSTPSDWRPGTGIPGVSVISFEPDIHIYLTDDNKMEATLILQEVGGYA